MSTYSLFILKDPTVVPIQLLSERYGISSDRRVVLPAPVCMYTRCNGPRSVVTAVSQVALIVFVSPLATHSLFRFTTILTCLHGTRSIARTETIETGIKTRQELMLAVDRPSTTRAIGHC
jgi:hypothetical protein